MSADRVASPRSYIAPHPVFTGGVLYRPGEPFSTSARAGAGWEPIDMDGVDRVSAGQDGSAGMADAGATHTEGPKTTNRGSREHRAAG